ncbi:cupin domain-containing protein [Daejeonella sp. H1SJ63]|uniref:cupin domain-containing protein n=1 Tax=Daejeonella sp. H1SJ63 TaxID=3034145 RepID=UPI0023EC90AD|nr:cupin domain-containing protein [Daejeonella sp. H1SJ63]
MIKDLIQQYGLLPHPEGGFYKETYRSSESIPLQGLPARFSGERAFSTAIYFLLVKKSFSAFHRIQSDECWHFYDGDSLQVHVLHSNGSYELIRLGRNSKQGEVYQAVVPSGSWFASETSGEYSFVGCTVAPGFDFQDFELAEAAALTDIYPEFTELIQRLCR